MAKVTIVGSHSNKNTSLPPGVVVTVERTPEVSKLISRGYAHIVPDVAPPAEEPTTPAESDVPEESTKPKRARRRADDTESESAESDG